MESQNPLTPRDASCLFCRIAAGEIPAHKVYEDQAVFCFLDIGPLTTGHCLLIPKAHYVNILDIPPALIAELGSRLPTLSRAVLKATGAPACHILLNSGPQAMQSVMHLHYHIIPRSSGDGFSIPWKTGKLDSGQAGLLAGKIGEFLLVERESIR